VRCSVSSATRTPEIDGDLIADNVCYEPDENYAQTLRELMRRAPGPHA